MMTFSEAVAAIQAGQKVKTASGSLFWLEHTAKGAPVLMGSSAGYDKPIKHMVFSSEHFSDDKQWEIVL